MAKRRWTDEELLSGMAAYIRQHAILPTAAEYMANRGDLPDESTIRERLGGWTSAWRRALRLTLAALEAQASEQGRVMPAAARPTEVGEREAYIIRRHREGAKRHELARELDISMQTVSYYLRRLSDAGHIVLRGREWPELRADWELALRGEWPMSVERLSLTLWGHTTPRSLKKSQRRLLKWLDDGLLTRYARGLYDLTPETHAARAALAGESPADQHDQPPPIRTRLN